MNLISKKDFPIQRATVFKRRRAEKQPTTIASMKMVVCH